MYGSAKANFSKEMEQFDLSVNRDLGGDYWYSTESGKVDEGSRNRTYETNSGIVAISHAVEESFIRFTERKKMGKQCLPNSFLYDLI